MQRVVEEVGVISKGESNGRSKSPTGVVIVDRNRMGSQLLAESLSRDSRFKTIVALPQEAASAIAAHNAQIGIISADLDSGRGQGIELARGLSRHHPHLCILILLDRVQKEAVIEAFRSGARGLFCRTEPVSEFIKCVDHVSRGEIWAGKAESDCLLEAFKSVPSPRLTNGGIKELSKRELQVVQLAAQGFTNKSIADELGLSEHTVKNYLFRAFEKLGVSSRVELLFYLTVKGQHMEAVEGAVPTPGRALATFQEAAEKGVAAAQFVMGLAYRDGLGVERDPQAAYFWLRVAQESSADLINESSTLSEEIRNQLTHDEIVNMDRKIVEYLAAGHRISEKLPAVLVREMNIAV